MRGFNRVIIAGNLTRDPELRATVNKRTYARFGVAVNSAWKNQNGELQERVDFINVVVWGQAAENCGKYLKKGSAVLLEGRLQTNTYDARDGSGKRTSTDVVVDNIQFLSSGQQQNQGGNSWQNNNNNNYSRQSAPTQQNMNNYNQPPAFDPPPDSSFGQPIGDDGFGP
ncbi:MAG: single-stranded DNA-binding protein, partial [Synergistaceae bacterium]|nr:single-stranded DNA-binding protein [Synergistaceae bacterium]